MIAIRVLGRYVPAEWNIDAIEQEFRRLACLPDCCRRERIEVRIPQGVEPHPNNLEWHQDGGGAEGCCKHMIVWASESPTELKDSDGSLFTAEPGDVVWFDNTTAYHRQPRGTNQQSRYFAAIRCSG